LTKWRDRPHYLWTMLGLTLIFPGEWISDYKWLMMDYDPSFIPIPYIQLPLMIPFAYAVFYAIPVIFIVDGPLKKHINKIPRWLFLAILYVIGVGYDLIVEGLSTMPAFHVWTYHWSPESSIFGGVPWPVPLTVGAQIPLYYLTYLWACKYSTKQKSWLKGFLIQSGFYLGVTAVFIVIGYATYKALGWPY
jgi:hypothetical protein